MVSVIVAAHDEEHVIGACLDALLNQVDGPPAQIIVSANGCTDGTTRVAAGRGVTVVERSEPGKSAALNAADLIATSFPRVYLDADIVLPADAMANLRRTLDSVAGATVVVPRRRMATVGRPIAVRAYFAINERLPVFRTGLVGRGTIMLSEAGRARFDRFPEMVADDLFVDSVFTEDERAVADDVEIVVQAPYRTTELVRRLARVRRGNAEMRAAAAAGDLPVTVRPSDKWAWFREVVRKPRLALAAAPYVVITLLAGRLAEQGQGTWGRDESTRTPPPDERKGTRNAD